MKKQDILNLLRDMPDEIDVERLMYQLYVIRKIELGEASIEKYGLIPDEELDDYLENPEKWPASAGP